MNPEELIKSIHDLATFYDIEILVEPTGHVIVDEDGNEVPLTELNITEIFIPNRSGLLESNDLSENG